MRAPFITHRMAVGLLGAQQLFGTGPAYVGSRSWGLGLPYSSPLPTATSRT